MLLNSGIIRRGALLVTVCAATSVGAQPVREGASEIVSRVEVLPRYNQWSLVEPELRPALKAAVRLPRKQREHLVREGSAAQRGVAIFIAEQQQDIKALLSYAHLLEDKETTLPFAAATAGIGQYAEHEQTVGEYLTATYLEWFGVNVDGSLKRFERLFDDETNPDHFVRPWIVRLRRAKDSPLQAARIRKQIDRLPDEVRWAVLTLGYKDSLYTLDDARAALSKIPQPIREAILSGADLLPTEPTFRMNDGASRRFLIEECRKLLNDARP